MYETCSGGESWRGAMSPCGLSGSHNSVKYLGVKSHPQSFQDAVQLLRSGRQGRYEDLTIPRSSGADFDAGVQISLEVVI